MNPPGHYPCRVMLPCLKRKGGAEVVATTDVVLPFVPVAGMMLGVTLGGDFLRVDEVFWHVDDAGRFEVWVDDGADAPLHAIAYWRKQGWELQT